MTKNITIAIVEDDADIADILSDLLSADGYQTYHCATSDQMLERLKSDPPDLVLLDRKLPDGDSISFAPHIVKLGIPLIMLTGKGSEIDRVSGLEVGADDYIVKPFSVHEVAARIRAVLRRSLPRSSPEVAKSNPTSLPKKGFQFDDWVIDVERRILFEPSGTIVDLTVGEFDLLVSIVAAGGRVLSRSQIMDNTHRTDEEVFDRTIDVLMFRLRRKIEQNPQNPKYLKTERGLGYRFGSTITKLDG